MKKGKTHAPVKKKQNLNYSKSLKTKGKPASNLNFNISPKVNNLLYYFGLGLVLILIIIIKKNYLTIPFERDEGFYAYCGKIILGGAKPFIDIGSQRLDGVFYVYALLVGIFGYSLKALHLAFLVLNLASAAMLFFLTRKLTNNIAAIAASAFFGILSMTAAASGFTIQSEHIVAFFVIAAFLCLFHFFETKKLWQLAVTGILFSFAFQTKQTSFFYGVLAGGILLYKGIFEDKDTFLKNLLNIGVFSLSVFIPIAIDLLIVYKNGAWADFNLWFFDIRKQYTAIINFVQGLTYLKMNFLSIYKDYKFFWIISFIGPVTIFFTSLKLWQKLTFIGLTISGFLTVVPGNHYYGHYFLQWIPAVSICGAAFVFSVFDILKNKLKSGYIIIPLLIIIFPVILNLNKLNNYYFTANDTQVLREVYGLNPFPESKVIADKLNSLMKEEDKLAVLGSEVEMYVYTNRKSPSRFAYSGALLEFAIPQSNSWQKEFISDVEKAAPRFLVFFSHPISWMANPKVENLIFPWFDKFTTKKYKLIGFADMYSDITNYVWEPDIDLKNNPPKSKYRIFVFEKR